MGCCGPGMNFMAKVVNSLQKCTVLSVYNKPSNVIFAIIIENDCINFILANG